jgi:uncharacterized membrane protein YfcA
MNIFTYILIALCGIVSGVLGGMGMGGGTLLIPMLTLLFSIPQKTAQAINLLSFLPMAALALVFHLKNGLIKYKKVAYIMLSGAAAGVIAAFLAQGVADGLLKTLFGIFIILLGAYQLYSAFNPPSNNE